MNYYRTSYLSESMQASVYNADTWPRNTLKSYAPRARYGYSRMMPAASFAARVPSALRQEVQANASVGDVVQSTQVAPASSTPVVA